ncbi:hypothetical protein D9619_004848 [Psilocybe cf. subviscida]|uniref:HTH APSES-type domain-containing protein n=1 Tax=Psilocybe cf. subviscida TaxID=2480587 RepID=A0A8H5BQW4_9AGAR|nr:hypothetical protein D9619_004848 [Psilocybe cf. subviscida]
MVARPPVPVRYANPKITHDRHLPPVKYQILNCQGKDILVGRLKVETPTETGHAFILRRFDTQAISLTTMFRAAFPNAPETDEKAEVNWVREHYDLSGNNGSTKDMHITRLAGTWVSPAVALELGEDYGLGALINIVVEAKPDPAANYRRSGKAAANNSATAAPTPASPAPPPYTTTAQAATVTQETVTTIKASNIPTRGSSKPPSASAVTSLPTPSPPTASPPTKRRKASSPAPASPRPSRIPALASPAPTPVTDRVIAPLRRSARTSPAPTRSVAATTVNRTPKTARSAVKKEASSTVTVTVSSAAPSGSELTVVDEETMAIEDGIIGSGLHEEDMAEQQKLLQEMAQKREAAKQEAEDEEDVLEYDPTGQKPMVRKLSKRRADELLAQPDKGVLVFQPGKEEADRVIATNRRVKAQSKSLLWGVAAFAVGVGAMFLPNFL